MPTTNNKHSVNISPGAFITVANKWPAKWREYTYRISEDGTMAEPLRVAHYWCSVLGKVEDISTQPPLRLEILLDTEPGIHNQIGNTRWIPEPSNTPRQR